jgi:hypothetical protein
MTKSNKGRFKCKDEAQAVWAFITHSGSETFDEVFGGDEGYGEDFIEYTAKCLHCARLIHGSIYDEDGRIEDKDVAHELLLSYQKSDWLFTNIDGYIEYSIRHGMVRGTNFY